MTPLKVLRREKRRGPRMYEMQGPRPVFLRRPADCSAALRLLDQPLVPATRPKRQFPGSSRVPGLPPDRYPSPAVTYFYCPGGGQRKGFRSPILRFLSCPQPVHRGGRVVPRSRRFSTVPSTASAQAKQSPGRLPRNGRRSSSCPPGGAIDRDLARIDRRLSEGWAKCGYDPLPCVTVLPQACGRGWRIASWSSSQAVVQLRIILAAAASG